MDQYREYDFPAAWIRVYPDGTTREFPKWCLSVNIRRSRDYTAEALRQLRRYRRTHTNPLEAKSA